MCVCCVCVLCVKISLPTLSPPLRLSLPHPLPPSLLLACMTEAPLCVCVCVCVRARARVNPFLRPSIRPSRSLSVRCSAAGLVWQKLLPCMGTLCRCATRIADSVSARVRACLTTVGAADMRASAGSSRASPSCRDRAAAAPSAATAPARSSRAARAFSASFPPPLPFGFRVFPRGGAFRRRRTGATRGGGGARDRPASGHGGGRRIWRRCPPPPRPSCSGSLAGGPARHGVHAQQQPSWA